MVCELFKTINHFFPDLFEQLRQIEDCRRQSDYSLSEILMAAIAALETLKRPCTVELHTDSTYVMKGISEWIANWKARGWKTAAKKPVKNVDLWQRLDEAASRHRVDWRWVKGHSGVPENERADELARLAIP